MRSCAQSSQRLTRPPSTEVRQVSIADITFNWARPTWPSLALRHAAHHPEAVFPSKDGKASKSIRLREEPLPIERPRLSGKLTKVKATANALFHRFTEGRPSMFNKQLLEEIKDEVGVVSARTLTRALSLAWSSAPRLGDKK